MLLSNFLILLISTKYAYCRMTSFRDLQSHMKSIELPSLSEGLQNDLNYISKRIKVKRAASDNLIDVKVNKLGSVESRQAVIHWSGSRSNEPSNAVFVLIIHRVNSTLQSTLYRSTDYGSSFSEMAFGTTTKLSIDTFYDCPVNKNNLIFLESKKEILFYTTDEGTTVKSVSLTFNPSDIRFHPVKDKTLLGYDYHARKLYISEDLGESWKIVSTDVNYAFYWGEPSVDLIGHDVVFIQTESDYSDGARFRACHEPLGTGTCNDQTFDNSIGLVDSNDMLVLGKYIFLKKTNSTRHVTLFVSYNRQPFREALFPPDVQPVAFQIVDNAERQIFVAAQERGSTQQDLYLSDTNGEYFTRCLTRVDTFLVSSSFYYVDVVQVAGLSGTYIANQRQANGTIKTLITRNKGADWKPLQPPTGSEKGKCPQNSKRCGLHLLLNSDYNHQPVSHMSAPGLIIATGNTGETAANVKKSPHLYTSADGGFTWNKAYDGLFQYSIIAQGSGIIVVNRSNTDQIYYSINEGSSWKSEKFLPAAGVNSLSVAAVVNEPGITTTVVTVFGHVVDNQQKPAGPWVVVKLNSSKLFSKECEDKDFVKWPSSPYCSLGVKTQYDRLTKDANCYIGANFTRQISSDKCPCSYKDYECSFGYNRSSSTDHCTRVHWFTPSTSHPPGQCPEGTSWITSTGYRLMASDQCREGPGNPPTGQKKACPLMPVSGLQLSVDGKQNVPVGDKVTFLLTQLLGSEKSTVYTWDFKDGTTPLHFTGLSKAAVQVKRFKKPGFYNVTVSAKVAGQVSLASAAVNILDRIMYVEPVIPGVHAGHSARLQVQAVKSDGWIPSEGECVYVWYFGDKPNHRDKESYLSVRPIFTEVNHVDYVFDEPGSYKASVEVFNPVSSRYKTFTVHVYANLYKTFLGFNDSSVRRYYLRSPVMKKVLVEQLENRITQLLAVDPSRVRIVAEETGKNTAVFVTVLPTHVQNTLDTANIDKQLRAAVKQQSLVIDLNGVVLAVNKIYDKPGDAGKHSTSSHMAIAIAAPVLISALVIATLIVLYYRRHFRLARLRRYRRLHQQEDAGESLLDDNDDNDAGLDDDDEPPLDIRTDLSQGPIVAEPDDDIGPFTGPL